jgi:hypothetical protein
MSELGRIPEVGDTVEAGGGTLSVTRMDGRRIDRICFRPHPEPDVGPGINAKPANAKPANAKPAEGKTNHGKTVNGGRS